MKLLIRLCAFLTLLSPMTAHAEYIVNQLTWVAKDKTGIGVIQADYANPAVRHWTTNGTTYDCNTTFVLASEYRTIVHCPKLNYTLDMRRDKLLVVANGGVAEYPGSWDDRRVWTFKKGDITGTFTFLPGLKWFERQLRGTRLIERQNFKETYRDDNIIYLYDASRSVHVALTKTSASIWLPGEANYKPLYSGHW